MDDEQLKTFLTVVELKNFTKTAEILHVTQSTITARIQQIEAFYGQPLLKRNKGNIQLTVMGDKLLPLLQRQMDLREQTKRVASETAEEGFQITISAAYSLWRKMNTQVIKELYLMQPHTHIHLKTDHSPLVIQHLLDGSIDFGIVYNKPMSKELSSVLIQKDTFSLYQHQDINICKPTSVSDLKNLPWVYLNWGHSFQAWLENENKQSIKPSLEVGHSDLAFQFIIDLKGIGFLSDNEVRESAYGDYLEAITCQSSVPIPSQSIYLIFKKSREMEPAIKAAVASFQQKKTL
ncbi:MULTISPECIES: LysR family transcriptional regulator [Gracilibacillus]|uniref:LysR family transcriptional regulator n=1 Tax=Gracilibacillus TaxID=74385 RepID=UPI000824FDF9|nr:MULTISPECIES: LysR family transcriptional regulator [Gracilibacillus]